MSIKKSIQIILVAAAVLIAAVFLLDCFGVINLDSLFSLSGRSNYVSFTSFTEKVAAGQVRKAEISSDKVVFVTPEGTFVTVNPDSPDFKAKLLYNGVDVEEDSDTSVSAALDIVFDVIFFGAVAFGIWKLLDFSKKTFRIVRKTGVRFSDIAGMDDVKSEMMYLVDVLKNPSAYSSKGIRQVKGVILEGPPGNGKTLFAKALAEEAGVNFIAAKGADFQSALMSMGSRKIRMLFSKASRHKPCIVFIDEFDSIGERRNYAGSGIDKENNRIITAMLNEMDGFTANSGLLVIAATNSFQSLDPALVRPGRFDIKFTVGNPDAATRKKLIEIYTKNKKFSSEFDIAKLAAAFDGLSCAAIETLLNEACAIADMSHSDAITSQHILAAAQKTGAKLKK